VRRVAVVAAVLLAAGAAACGAADDRAAAPRPPDPLAAALRRGALTLVVRHAKTDAVVDRRERLGSCAEQRNLTAGGRAQARAIGRGVRALGVPLGDVRASPLCRTRDTAVLAFGADAVRIDRDLVSPGLVGSAAGDRRRAARLRALVRRPPPPGRTRVLVAHTGNIGAALGQETVDEGETLVYGAGGRLVGRVPAERWDDLARR